MVRHQATQWEGVSRLWCRGCNDKLCMALEGKGNICRGCNKLCVILEGKENICVLKSLSEWWENAGLVLLRPQTNVTLIISR